VVIVQLRMAALILLALLIPSRLSLLRFPRQILHVRTVHTQVHIIQGKMFFFKEQFFKKKAVSRVDW